MDVSPKYAPKSAVTCAQCNRSISKDEVSDTIRYNESLAGNKLKVWWHGDKMYYEGVLAEHYPDRKKHKVSYVDGDEVTMNLREEKWRILNKFSARDVEEQNTEEVGKDNDIKESEDKNVNYNDVKESVNQNENNNYIKKAENEAVIPPEKDKDAIQEFSPKAVESKHAATANVASPSQRNSVLDESSVWYNKKKATPQEVEIAYPSKSGSLPDETCVKKMDVYPKSVSKSALREGNSTETPVTNAKHKRSTSKAKVSGLIKYDESLVGSKLKVWWPADKMYYKGVVAEFYPDRKMHKVLYADGDVEILDLRKEKWRILKKFSGRDVEEHNTKVQSEEGFPDIHTKKKSKIDPAASQENIKVGDVSSSDKSKGSTPKDNQLTQKTSGKPCDAATTASKEAAKSKEDEERLKISSKTKTVNKSNGKIPPSSSKFNVSGPTKAEKMEHDKERLRLEAEKLKIKADKGQSKIRLQEERLRLEAEKMELLKKESDIRIMTLDTRVMPEMQRLYFEELQREIIMRRSYA